MIDLISKKKTSMIDPSVTSNVFQICNYELAREARLLHDDQAKPS
jgi:hypothetical protein